MKLGAWITLGILAGCAPTGGDDATDDGSGDTDVVVEGTSAQGTAGDTTLTIDDGVALAKVEDQGSNRVLSILLGEGTAACPSFVHDPGSSTLRIVISRPDGSDPVVGTVADGDSAAVLEVYTSVFSDTCGESGALSLGSPSTVTLTEVGDTVAGTFSITMYRTTPAPENTGVVTGSFSAPLCETYGARCEF